MMIFKDRESAGELLAKRLADYKNKQDMIVLGIPRGGVVVAFEIAKKLRLPLDIVVTRKIGAPFQKELALGAVDPAGQVVWEEGLLEDLGFKIQDLRDEVSTQLNEIERREKLYRASKPPLDVENKEVILVDDGIATGATMLSSIRYLKSVGASRVLVAVPVVAEEVMKKISLQTDKMVVLHAPEFLGAVGSFYEDFSPVSDQEVIELLI